MNIYSYTPQVTPGPNGTTLRYTAPSDDAQQPIELATKAGRRYVGVPSGTIMPAQPPEIDWREEPNPPPEATQSRWLHLQLTHLAHLRWRHETGGITWDNLPVATDETAQAKLSGAMLGVITSTRTEPSDWKFADSIARPLTNAQLQAMATAVSAHVQACYTHEATLATQLRDSQTPDITTGWPE